VRTQYIGGKEELMSATPDQRNARREQGPPSLRGALVGLSLTVLLASLGTSIANVALPTLAQAFHASIQHAQWVVLAYLLASTTTIVSVGRLGDVIGRRRLLIAGLALFTVASALCGIAPTLWTLIAARAAQGLGAAIMLALAMALVSETVPKARTGSAMGLLGTMSAIGTALGPSLGGLLIAAFGWRSIFLVIIPAGIVTGMLVTRHPVADQPVKATERAPFDGRGTLLLALTLASYTLAVTVGGGAFGPLNVALLTGAAIALALFALTQIRTHSPLIRLAMLRSPRLSAGLATSTLVSTVLMTTLVVGPFYLTGALDLEAASVGLVMSIGPVVAALTGVPAGRIADRIGARGTTAVGLIGIATGSLALAALATTLDIVGYVVPIVLITASYAFFQTGNNTNVMSDVSPDERGVTSGMLNLSRSLGLITGASVMGAVFAFAAGTSDITTAPSNSIATATRITFLVAAALILVALLIAVASRPRRVRRATSARRSSRQPLRSVKPASREPSCSRLNQKAAASLDPRRPGRFARRPARLASVARNHSSLRRIRPAAGAAEDPSTEPASDRPSGWDIWRPPFQLWTRQWRHRLLGLGPEGEEVADLASAGERIWQGQVGLDGIAVASAVTLAGDVASGYELDDDAVGGSFGDPDRVAEFAQPDLGVVRDADQHLSVVGEERPGSRSRHRYLDYQH
jgi:EmrB/QacA subfamily drug resistance transporter